MIAGEMITGLSHIGVRVSDYGRARAFYELLGFKHAWGPVGPEPVAAMRHDSGLELNFIVNALAGEPNILMDAPEKHAGYTHIALAIEDLTAVEVALKAAGVEISGRRGEIPVKALFFRDPDRNVVELASD